MHIDGCTNARQIARRAEVDLEMVQACLRVLAHHGVISLVDMFFFSNRYESRKFINDLKLLQAAAVYISKSSTHEGSPSLHSVASSMGGTPERARATPSSYPPERFAASSLPSDMGSVLREDLDMIKIAVIEIYAACSRDVTWGELWVSLLSGERQIPGRTTEFWQKVYSLVDHRRFAGFGVVHGILQRVHEYPLLMTSSHQAEDSEMEKQLDGRHCDDELAATFDMPFDEMLAAVGRDRVVSVYCVR